MAGNGIRFVNAGFTESKPMIKVFKNKVMIDLVLENILIDEENVDIYCCVLGKDVKLIKHLTKKWNTSIIFVDEVTSGPAATCLLAKSFINNKNPLLIVNSDQYIHGFHLPTLTNYAKEYDAVLGTFFSNSSKNSYVKINEDNLVTEVKEKEVISNLATNGVHFWNHGCDFINSAEKMIKNKDCAKNGEYYIAPSFNYLIKSKKRVGVYHYNEHYPIGVPEDLSTFQKEFKEKF
jgi:bifunctional N-acetylglucosamine-1-phosphate-uridyltransferase/glucosamine-1-phosphate-acetyltransferase GlmU-like protein